MFSAFGQGRILIFDFLHDLKYILAIYSATTPTKAFWAIFFCKLTSIIHMLKQ